MSSWMHWIGLFVACLAYMAASGRLDLAAAKKQDAAKTAATMGANSANSQSTSQADQSRGRVRVKVAPNPLKALTLMLSAFNPSEAWSVGGKPTGVPANMLGKTGSTLGGANMLTRRQRASLRRGPLMSDDGGESPDTNDAEQQALETVLERLQQDELPVETLLKKLKAEEDSPEVSEAIKQLEQIRDREETSQASLSSSVAAVAVGADLQSLADDCLEEGCSIDAVTALIAQLKAQKSNPQIEETIKLLEKELPGLSADQSQVEELVSAVSKKMSDVAHTISSDNVLQFSDAVTTCIEDGCSIPTVEELLAKYKAQDIPDDDLAKQMKQLEALLEKQQTKQNAIQKVVSNLARSYTTPAELMDAFNFRRPKLRTSLSDVGQALTYEELALNCLEEGCSLDTVEELVKQLKNEAGNVELETMVKKLEKEIDESDANKDEIEKLVSGLVSSYTSPGDVFEKLRKPVAKPGIGEATLTYEQLAKNCLEEGCPVDTVEELVNQLKADEDLTSGVAGLTEIIEQLEKELAKDKVSKNAISKLVSQMVSSYTTPGDVFAVLRQPAVTSKTSLDDVGPIEELALKCLEEGCDVEAVEELLKQLQAEDDPELADTIKELENELAQRMISRNEMKILFDRVASGLPGDILKRLSESGFP